MNLSVRSDPERDTAVMLGDPRKAIFATVIPFFISAVVGQINMLADLAWCSALGSGSVSAIQSVTPLYWVVFDVGLGIGLGCNVIIAHRIGFGDREGARRIVAQGTVLSVAIAFALAPLVFFLISPMLSFMGAPELAGMSTQYLLPILALNVFQVLTPALSGFLRGEGASNKSNLALIIGTLVNIALDPIFIFAFGMGVSGAGLATAMSSVTSVSMMLYFYLSRRTTIPLSFRGYRFHRKDMAEILYLGMPKMAEMFLMDTLDAFNRVFLIACGGIDAVTLFSVPFRVVILAAMVPNSFSMAMTPVVSANLGAGKPGNAVYAFRLCMKCALGISAFLAVLCIIFAHYLMLPFTVSESMEALRPELETILRISVLMAPAMSAAMVCSAMMQSMKKPMYALAVTTVRTASTTALFAALCSTSVPIMCSGMVIACAMSAAIALAIVLRSVRKLPGHVPAG